MAPPLQYPVPEQIDHLLHALDVLNDLLEQTAEPGPATDMLDMMRGVLHASLAAVSADVWRAATVQQAIAARAAQECLHGVPWRLVFDQPAAVEGLGLFDAHRVRQHHGEYHRDQKGMWT